MRGGSLSEYVLFCFVNVSFNFFFSKTKQLEYEIHGKNCNLERS